MLLRLDGSIAGTAHPITSENSVRSWIYWCSMRKGCYLCDRHGVIEVVFLSASTYSGAHKGLIGSEFAGYGPFPGTAVPGERGMPLFWLIVLPQREGSGWSS